ncbi:hypothetical protein BGZ60DRAFT_548882 [Tricladium varicosporioides]|nr:hypothetical protein BGZ60DRAFT_548882 [Hymenoscyphus varicosporioides]
MSTTSTYGLQALSGSLLAITTIIVALRFYARHSQHTYIGADDWMIIPGYMTFLPFSIQASLVVSLDILSAASLGFTRISALLFFRRVFCVPGRTKVLRITIYTAILVISLWMAAFIILPPLQCGPDLSVWSAPANVRAAHCKLGGKFILGFCISDLVIETAIIWMPIPLVLRLHASVQRRLAVLFVFLTAFVSLGAVVARLIITTKILQKHVRDKSQTNTTQTFMWILEAGFALIAVNLPTLWWLRKKVQAERVLASIRSAMSLHSIHSNDGGNCASQQIEGSNKNTERERSSISQTDTSSHENFVVTYSPQR